MCWPCARRKAELMNGRMAMMGLITTVGYSLVTGSTVIQVGVFFFLNL